jgi:hypothetical protein
MSNSKSKEIGTISVPGIGSISIKDDKSLNDAEIFLELLSNRVRQDKINSTKVKVAEALQEADC